jgi:Zn-dependent peptidase ImmA (M78 family)
MIIHVFGLRIKVVVVDQMPEGYEHAMGIFDPDNGRIWVLRTKDKKHMRDTLAHEIGHAALMHCGIMNANISEDIQEVIVDCIGRAIVANLDAIRSIK